MPSECTGKRAKETTILSEQRNWEPLAPRTEQKSSQR